MKKILGLSLCVLLATSFACISCSGGGDDNPANPPSYMEELSPEDMAKTDAVLVKEANSDLSNGNYKSAVDKFRVAYKKNPSDANKIYYALTEIAILSVDDTVVDIIRNKLGATSYPSTLNALFNSEWAKDKSQPVFGNTGTKTYPIYESEYFYKFVQDSNGSYIRVSGTPTNTSSTETRYFISTLYNGEWKNSRGYLTNITPDANGLYLVDRDSTKDASVSADYRYSAISKATQDNNGSYIRVSGTPTSTSSSETRYFNYTLYNGEWKYYSGYLTSITPDANGLYLVYRDSTKDASVSADYRYNVSGGEYKAVLGKKSYTLPELAVPSWVTSQDIYKAKLIGTTQSFETWIGLLYANAVTNSENGVNDSVDKLLPVIHKKNETIKGIVDSLGTGTATLEPSFLSSLNLTELLGEDAFTIGKTEMNLLSAALEGIDAVLHYAASYDLSANLKMAQTDIYHKQNIIKLVKNCVTAKTLTNRDSQKMEESKKLFIDALGRIISSYDGIKTSTTYPQVIKDNIAEYGDILYDGAVKAKAALENGSVLWLPEELKGKTFPADINSAKVGFDMGKLFAPGYLTKLFERSDDLSTVKIYYKRFQTITSIPSYEKNETSGEITEISDIDAFFNTTINDAGYTNNGTSSTEIWYQVGILANQSVLSAAMPSAQNLAEKYKFITSFEIQ